MAGQPILRRNKPDYESLGLRGNPFPIAGLARPKTPYPMIEEQMDAEVRGFLQDTLFERRYGGMAVLGEFGSGKTYALRYMETLLGTMDISADAEEILPIYIERPLPTVREFVADVCERIGPNRIRNIVLEMILADASTALRGSTQEGRRAKRLIDLLRENPSGRLRAPEEAILELLRSPGVAMNPVATLEALRGTWPDTQFLATFGAEALQRTVGASSERDEQLVSHLVEFSLASGRERLKSWQSLLAGRVLRHGTLATEVSGQVLWSFFRRLLSRAGCAMVYWLVDEFEELEYQHKKKPASVRAFLADFRDLIDANTEGFALVLAAKPHEWQFMRALNPAFSLRFSRVVILRPNTPSDLKEMIRRRLERVRENDWTGDDLQPFTPEALDSLYRLSKGNTRTAVESCHVLLWHAATSGKQEITARMVDAVDRISQAFLTAKKGDVEVADPSEAPGDSR